MIGRRAFLFGAAAMAAPAIIRPGILMPVKRILLPEDDGVALVSIAHPWSSAAGESPWWERVEIRVSELRPATIVDDLVGVVMNDPGGFHIFRGDIVARR